VQFIEAAFHGSAAIILALAAWRKIACGQRLAIYLTFYALLRFTLEEWRGNPAILFGLSWYQFLALAVFALAGGTWLRRRRTIRNLSAAR
jgi:prolipoprotein diacylglyceryltransferase